MVAGSAMRIFSLPALYFGTMLIGLAVAVINVLMPSLVSVHFPTKIGLYTTLYITMMGVASTIGSSLAVPVVTATSWKTFILLLTALVAMAALIWLPNWRYNHYFEKKETAVASESLWKNKAALVFLVFGGLQSLLFYTEMTWLPTIAQTAGLTKAEAGMIAGVYSLISIPVSMVTPAIVSALSNKGRMIFMTITSCLTLVGLCGLALAPANMLVWIILALLLGLSVSVLFPYMMLSFSLKTTSSQATARLSGMVQSGGYCIAAVGPVLLGYSFPVFGSWLPLIISLAVLTLIMMSAILYIERHDQII